MDLLEAFIYQASIQHIHVYNNIINILTIVVYLFAILSCVAYVMISFFFDIYQVLVFREYVVSEIVIKLMHNNSYCI